MISSAFAAPPTVRRSFSVGGSVLRRRGGYPLTDDQGASLIMYSFFTGLSYQV